MNDTRELHIASYLTEKRSDRNHCVPVLDVFQDPLEPDMSLLVMPLLRRFNDPEFGTINEVMDFVRQSIDVNVPLENCLLFISRHYRAYAFFTSVG